MAASPNALGTRCGPYRLLSRLGESAAGAAYLATDERGVVFTVTLLPPDLPPQHSDRAQLAQSLAAAQRVRHPRIARVVAADVMTNPPYVATDFVAGPTLDRYVREQGPWGAGRAVRLGTVLAQAVTACHEAEVVHGAITPSAIVVTDDGPMLCGVGMPRATATRPATPSGQPAAASPQPSSQSCLDAAGISYLSPEVLAGAQISPAGDWWGWAATLAYLATGRAPFGEGALPQVLGRMLRGDIDLAGVDPRLAQVLRKALLPLPPDRVTGPQVLSAWREEILPGMHPVTAALSSSAAREVSSAGAAAAPRGLSSGLAALLARAPVIPPTPVSAVSAVAGADEGSGEDAVPAVENEPRVSGAETVDKAADSANTGATAGRVSDTEAIRTREFAAVVDEGGENNPGEDPAATAAFDVDDMVTAISPAGTAEFETNGDTQPLPVRQLPMEITAETGPLVPLRLLRRSPAWVRNLQAVTLIILAMVFPGFAILVGVAGVWAARIITKQVERLLRRRLQRGPRRWDAAREGIFLPWRAIQVLPQTVVTCAVALAVAWLVREGLLVLLDPLRHIELVHRFSQPLVLAIAAGVALLLIWRGPGGRAVRGGVGVTNSVIAAGRKRRRAIITIAVALMLVAVVRFWTAQPPDWHPLAIPHLSWNWLIPRLHWTPLDWPWQ